MEFTDDVKSYFINPNSSEFLVLEPLKKDLCPYDWLQANKQSIEKNILKYGGLLLRNFNINSVSEFNRFVQILCPTLLDYTYRSTPRTKLGGKIYTATEYPADRSIPLHNENSYTRLWPQKIIFFSAIVASQGGETPIANSRKIYQKIDSSVKSKFEQNGVLYVRNYTNGIDLSWQEVFQTDAKNIVEAYCFENGINMQWGAGIPELTTQQICQATTTHPLTGEKVWFNQAHLFHSSVLDEPTYKTLLEELGENNLPRNAFYGDGTPIEIEVLKHIQEIYQQEKMVFKWQKGDLMILDNLLMAHGREPYVGDRKVVVAMS